jgi:hypothetical protein
MKPQCIAGDSEAESGFVAGPTKIEPNAYAILPFNLDISLRCVSEAAVLYRILLAV